MFRESIRGACALVLLAGGVALFWFSAAVAFCWGHRPLSLPGILIAVVASALGFRGYQMIRKGDAEPIAAFCVYLQLGIGGVVAVIGVLAIPFAIGTPMSEDLPITYLLVVGCLSVIGCAKFHSYRAADQLPSR